MKTFILLLLNFSFIAFTAYGQATPPPLVSKAFSQKYPAAQNVQWSSQNKDFKVIFNADGFNYEARYNADGNWMISQRPMVAGEVPTVVKSGLSASKFSNWQINSAYILFLPGMITKYRILVSKDGDTKNLLMSWDGKLLDDNFAL